MGWQAHGRIHEILAVFLEFDPEIIIYFKQCLLDEVRGYVFSESEELCCVCHREIGEIALTCVSRDNTGMCEQCTYIFDPLALGPSEAPPEKSFSWGPTGIDSIPVREGDTICLQCGPYTCIPHMRRKYAVLYQARSAIDALLSRDQTYGTLTLAFIGWRLVRKVRKLGQWQDDIEGTIGQFLTFAEETRLQIAISLRNDHITLFVSTLRTAASATMSHR